MTAALARLGGMIIHPRRTLRAVLAGEGSFFELLPWFVLVSMAAAPKAAGQALMMLRADIPTGLRLFVGNVANRTGSPMVVAALVAVALTFVSGLRHRDSKQSPGFDRMLDACAYCLVPYLLLAAIGAALAASGMEVWFMPHRMMRGQGWYLAARALAAYGWPLVLLGIVAVEVWRVEPEAEG